MIKIIEHLPPFFEEIIDELTGQQQGAQARHNWQSEIWNKINECINQVNFISNLLLKSIRPTFDEVIESVRGKEIVTCKCGVVINNMEELKQHYDVGHFDKDKI